MANNFQDNYYTMLSQVDQQLQDRICGESHNMTNVSLPNVSMPSPILHPSPYSIENMHPSPYSIENMPWAQPAENFGIMHFKAHTNFLDDERRRALLHSKRKCNPPASQMTPPSKQFITEEKITAHFNGLHISNNFTQNENTSSVSSMDIGSLTEQPITFANFQDYSVTAKELEEKLRNANRITLCEDFKKLQDEQKKTTLSSLMPEVLINRIEKPCTALVLWQPPPILELLHRKKDEELKNKQAEIIEDVEFETDDIDDFIDNNNTCTVDYNKFNGDMDEDL